MRAIILCAGKGVRCRPVTLFRPKPLIPIDGMPMVESQIRYLKQNGIDDITLITGYLAEQFDYLAEKYGLALRRSALFDTTNNNSSLLLAADLLNDCLVMDGDLHFTRHWLPDIIQGSSQFLVQPITSSLEWAVRTKDAPDGAKLLLGVEKWTTEGYGMSGVSYWTGAGAKTLIEELRGAEKDEYWEDSALRAALKTDIYCVFAPAYTQEIDSLQQARQMDLLADDEIAELCSPNGRPVKLKGLTNNTYMVQADAKYVLRIPGRDTEKFIDRSLEPRIVGLIAEDGVTPRSSFYPDGFKLCDYLADDRISQAQDLDDEYFRRLSELLARLHAKPWKAEYGIPPTLILNELQEYEGRLKADQPVYFSEEQRQILRNWAEEFDAGPRVLCHRDLLLENILIGKDAFRGKARMQLIDFEYAGFTHPLWDAASFILEAELSGRPRMAFFQVSAPDYSLEQLIKMEILVDYIWGIWGYVNNYIDYAHTRLERAMKAFLNIKNSD